MGQQFLPGEYVRYLGHVYRVVWCEGDRVRIGIPGTVHPGYWFSGSSFESLKPTHWTLSVGNPFLSKIG